MRLSDRVGKTGLLQLTEKLFVKLEFMNPTGSIKDRPATYIINDAEKRKLLKKGDTIIEATSGNMGISFAWLAAERGYNCKIVMPSNMSEERKQMLRLYGAELIEVSAGNCLFLLVLSTTSPSTIVIFPTPALQINSAAKLPTPPKPTTKTLELINLPN